MQAVAVGLIFLSVSVLHDAQLLSDAPTTVPELEPGRDLRVHCSGVRKSTCRPEQFGWSGVQYACRTPLHKRAFRAIYMTQRLWVAGLLFAMSTLAPLAAKWRAFSWTAHEVDGHDMGALVDLMGNVPDGSGRPVAIIARTVKGKGVSFMEDDNNWHYRIPTAEEVEAARRELGVR